MGYSELKEALVKRGYVWDVLQFGEAVSIAYQPGSGVHNAPALVEELNLPGLKSAVVETGLNDYVILWLDETPVPAPEIPPRSVLKDIIREVILEMLLGPK